ncbi:hypothetical protein BC833DRAFT_588817 [Globomyces pollinis-pini]|nr:hypothetical protein BC833DRAFT_588817 [Globomyces pollinis-pini]
MTRSRKSKKQNKSMKVVDGPQDELKTNEGQESRSTKVTSNTNSQLELDDFNVHPKDQKEAIDLSSNESNNKRDQRDLINTLSLLQLDEKQQLFINIMDLLDEYQLQMNQLQKTMAKGFIELSQAKYSYGEHRISQYQYDSRMESLVKLTPNETSSQLVRSKSDPTLKNPILWFGVLVPQSLKLSQTNFVNSLDLVLNLSNIQLELSQLTDRFNKL